jgi:hypothetical protein
VTQAPNSQLTFNLRHFELNNFFTTRLLFGFGEIMLILCLPSYLYNRNNRSFYRQVSAKYIKGVRHQFLTPVPLRKQRSGESWFEASLGK